MFDKTVTVFNKYVNQKDEIYWYPTVISGCQFVDDKAANVAKTGLENADEANLHIRYTYKMIADTGKTVYRKNVSGKVYLPPKEWRLLHFLTVISSSRENTRKRL